MSVAGFHHPFKSVTAMSPLQFQKRLRFQEARRLMLGEGLDAAYFNREYKGLFGLPPMRDMERLREYARESAAADAFHSNKTRSRLTTSAASRVLSIFRI